MSSELSPLSDAAPLTTGATQWTAGTPARWRENPERLAWAVILLSFAIFITLLFTTYWGVSYTFQYATVRQSTQLKATLGTLLLYERGSNEAIAITNQGEATPYEVVEGSRIETTTGVTQGSLDLIRVEGRDDALGSVRLSGGTSLTVQRVRQPFFARSVEPYKVQLYLARGETRIFTNNSETRDLSVTVISPHGRILLGQGTYWISVTPEQEQTAVTVRAGQAKLLSNRGDELTITDDLGATMTATALYQVVATVEEQNLLENSDFAQPWPTYVKGQQVKTGRVVYDEANGRTVAHFIRLDGENLWNEVGITQEVNQDVDGIDHLYVQLEVRLLFQSLSGAGEQSSEFPLRYEIEYTSIYGQELTWGEGFYYRDPEGHFPIVSSGTKIPPRVWWPYVSADLMDVLKDTPPARIKRIRIYASGWNYESMISEVYLLAK